MTDAYFEELRVEILDLLAKLEIGKLTNSILSRINGRIVELNKTIYSVNIKKIDTKDSMNFDTIEYYQTIHLCLQYYQIRDRFLLLEG